jgi:hypothetical protein
VRDAQPRSPQCPVVMGPLEQGNRRRRELQQFVGAIRLRERPQVGALDLRTLPATPARSSRARSRSPPARSTRASSQATPASGARSIARERRLAAPETSDRFQARMPALASRRPPAAASSRVRSSACPISVRKRYACSKW